eukprot:16587-Heterococcus_DN1.PRE.6
MEFSIYQGPNKENICPLTGLVAGEYSSKASASSSSSSKQVRGLRSKQQEQQRAPLCDHYTKAPTPLYNSNSNCAAAAAGKQGSNDTRGSNASPTAMPALSFTIYA